MGFKHEETYTFSCDLCKAEQKMTSNDLPEYWGRFEMRTSLRHGAGRRDHYIVCGNCYRFEKECENPQESVFRKLVRLMKGGR